MGKILTPWKKEEIKLLIDGLTNKKMKPAELGRMLRKPRNSVSGQISRLRSKGLLPSPTKKVSGMRNIVRPKLQHHNPFLKGYTPPVKKLIEQKDTNLIGLFNTYSIKDSQCHFPVPLNQKPNEHMMMCGASTIKGSWCPVHSARVWRNIHTREVELVE